MRATKARSFANRSPSRTLKEKVRRWRLGRPRKCLELLRLFRPVEHVKFIAVEIPKVGGIHAVRAHAGRTLARAAKLEGFGICRIDCVATGSRKAHLRAVADIGFALQRRADEEHAAFGSPVTDAPMAVE